MAGDRLQLDAAEAAVLEKLLAGEHPVLRSLREQLSGLSVIARKHTGVGFFTELRAPAHAPVLRGRDLRIGDVEASIRGLRDGAGFLLYVDDGRITMLEGYSYDEPWPDELEIVALDYTDPSRAILLSSL